MDRFQQIDEYMNRSKAKKPINEFAFLTELNEEGEDEQQGGGAPQNMESNAPQPNGTDGGMDAPMPNTPSAEGGDMGGQAPDNGGNAPMSNEPPMEGGADALGGPQQGDMMPPMDMGMDNAPMGGDDEVIDVDDLTQSQESTELRIDDMNDKLDTLAKVLQKYSEAVDSLDSKIADVKDEIAHRMPTKQEKLELRSVASTPYAISPEEYWSNKLATNPNYSIEQSKKEEESFDITEDDLADYNSYDVMRSFNENKMELKNYLQF